MAAARARVREVFGEEEEAAAEPEAPTPVPAAPSDISGADRAAWTAAVAWLEKAVRLRPRLERADADEVDELTTALRDALAGGDLDAARARSAELADVLFYLE
jgi:hypothetical protein